MSPKKSREERGKTLAMRVLEGAGVPYEVYEFPDTVHDAVEVARHTGVPPQNVYKTLVAQAEDPGFKPMLVMIAAESAAQPEETGRCHRCEEGQDGAP